MKSPEEILSFEAGVKNEGHLRAAQKALAIELTSLVHGEEALASAQRITEVFFSGLWDKLSFEELKLALADVPEFKINVEKLLLDTLVEAKIATSKREAREFIENGSISLNGSKVTDLNYQLTKKSALYEKMIVIRKGKKNYFLVVFE